jgi:hypothetical protein
MVLATIPLGAIGIQTQGVVRDGEALGFRHRLLPLLDFGVVKLFHLAAIQTYEVIMVLAFIELVNCLSAFKMASAENGGLFELGQHTVHSGQAHV